MNAKQVIEKFGMQPNPVEGGYFAQVYTSAIVLDNSALPGFKKITEKRPLCGGIYYLVDSESVSLLHRVTGDMLYHFYMGDPVQQLLLYPDGSYEIATFSSDNPMKVIPGGTWLGSKMDRGGQYALMGVTMAPGYVPEDYELGNREELDKEYPAVKGMIRELTKG